MNDTEVQKQIRQMVAFIDQEANEKAAEIDAKAQEEFAIEKDNLVNQQKQKIQQFYLKKEKQVELQRKIQYSNLQNASRIAILKAREDLIQKLKEDANSKLSDVTKNPERYLELLSRLIAQTFFRLTEKDVFIKCREADVGLVEQAIVRAKDIYKTELKRDVNCTLMKVYLPAHTSGGIEAFTGDGKIRVINTLEARLNMLFSQMVPEIRVKLFGKNVNRVHDN